MTPRDILLAAVIVIAGLVAFYLCAMLMVGVFVRLPGTSARIGNMFLGWFAEQSDEYERRKRRTMIDDDIRRALGLSDEWGSQQRADVVKAARASLEINVLYKFLKKSACECNATHFAVADGLGTTEMNDAARHPLCGHQRQRVIDCADMLCDKIERYPLILDAPELIRVRFGIESIPSMCTRCPYFTMTLATAPRMCPTSGMLGPESTPRSGGVVDGDIVEDPNA
jgi:hypothetical protein